MGIERVRPLALVILVAGVASCAATVAEPGTPVTVTSAAADSEKPPSSGSASDVGEKASANGGGDAALSSSLEAVAKATLSEYLSRPVAEIELVSIVPIDWRDSSLGCPKPGRGYMQVITPGHYAVLRHGGQTYRVHMAKGRALVCDRPPDEVSPDKQLAPQLAMPLERLQSLARADLARRLGVPVEQVSFTGAQPVVWRDSNLGCPQEGQSYETAATKGYVLGLSYRGRVYAYHTDRYRLLPCPPFANE